MSKEKYSFDDYEFDRDWDDLRDVNIPEELIDVLNMFAISIVELRRKIEKLEKKIEDLEEKIEDLELEIP
ncbi:MAG: hypothetical protein JHC30_07250 [Caldisericum sp.]|jgi:predicted  nucleic acid-binding Zn-ribbon protein|nr:hypothetical protein [Caldisericum sp.]